MLSDLPKNTSASPPRQRSAASTCTNLLVAQCDAAATVRAYNRLGRDEHAFRSLKAVDPVFH
jgi:hypothetical protein